MRRYIEGRITLKKIEEAVERARQEGFRDGLHTMHERYVKGEPHGLDLVEHKCWQMVNDYGLAAVDMVRPSSNGKITGLTFEVKE